MVLVNNTVSQTSGRSLGDPPHGHAIGASVTGVTGVSPLAPFLLPEGFAAPGLLALARESRVIAEVGRSAAGGVGGRRRRHATSYVARSARRDLEPVVLVPGFLAGDASLRLLGARLRTEGWRTYRSEVHANIGCTRSAADRLEARIEMIARRRDSPVQLVGHSLGGMLARSLAARRPDLVSGIVTMGSPMLAPGAHHLVLTASIGVLLGLQRRGMVTLMGEDCVRGDCARASFEQTRALVPAGTGFTALYSRHDGVVDWRACIDPRAVAVEVSASHLGMAVDACVARQVAAALGRHHDEHDRYDEHDRQGGGWDGGSPAPPAPPVAPVVPGSGLGSGEGA